MRKDSLNHNALGITPIQIGPERLWPFESAPPSPGGHRARQWLRHVRQSIGKHSR